MSFKILSNASASDASEIAKTAQTAKKVEPVVEETTEKKTQKRNVQRSGRPQRSNRGGGNQRGGAPRQRGGAVASTGADGFVSGRKDTRRGGRGKPHGYKPPSRGRKFDRHPADGRQVRDNKKGGRGKANWGAEGEEKDAYINSKGGVKSNALEQSQPKVESVQTADEVPVPATNEDGTPVETPEAGEETEKKEEEDNSESYDEYLKKLKEKKAIQIRKSEGPEVSTSSAVKLEGKAYVRQNESKKPKKVVKQGKSNKNSKPQTQNISEFLDEDAKEKLSKKSEQQLFRGDSERSSGRGGFRGGRGGRGGRGRGRGGNSSRGRGRAQKRSPKFSNEEFPAL